MKPRDLAELLLLAAIWGSSFLFMRLSAAEFGPTALAAVRVGVAFLVLLPLLVWHGALGALRQHWRPICVVGLANSAIPFVCFAYAALSLTAGLSAIFNATAPLFAAAIAWLWLRERPAQARVIGLVVGFAGVLWLAWNKASFKPGGTGWAVVACLFATLLYGFAANFTRKRLAGVPPLALATGSQLASAIVLVPLAAFSRPAVLPGVSAWAAAVVLAVVCTAVAYVLYFRLIAQLGATRAISVTYLIPLFAMLWGALFLHESVTLAMVLGGSTILLGTAITTGLLALPGRGSAQAAQPAK